MNRFVVTIIFLFILARGVWSVQPIKYRITVTNPAATNQAVNVKKYLPEGVEGSDILNMEDLQRQGFMVRYDVRQDKYYLYRQTEVAAKETKTYEVSHRNIWVLPEEYLNKIQAHAAHMREQPRKRANREKAASLDDEIKALIAKIRIRQKDQTPSQKDNASIISAFQEISGIEQNVLRKVVELENLLLSIRLDPGEIITNPPNAINNKRELNDKDSGDRVAVIELTVMNTSFIEAKEIPFNSELPVEISPEDVLDADGLEVKADFDKDSCYLYSEGILLKPNEAKTFKVKIRDKWNVNGEKIEEYSSKLESMISKDNIWTKYPSMVATIKSLRSQVNDIASDNKPTEINPSYVAYYRKQTEQLNDIGNLIHRITTAPYHPGGAGLEIDPPTKKTTWIIIYVILGFLALMSFIALLKTK